MIITDVHIRNFRALKDVTLSMSSFSCIIGENNSGKSSVMRAIQVFLKPAKLSESDYYDRTQPVIISVTMSVDERDLSAITNDEHRTRMVGVVQEGVLTLTESFRLNDKPEMTCRRKVPRDDRWREANVTAALRGNKTGAALRAAALEAYPEIHSALDAVQGSLTQTKVKEVIADHVLTLGPEDCRDDDFVPLPTGLDASVKSLLPDPIYIEAVKDIAADVKTTKEAVFGKLLALLLGVIQSEAEMNTFRETLTQLNAKLNVIKNPDGGREDNRFKQVIALERTIETNLREQFPEASVTINIPPPDLHRILQSAEIDVHDGGVEDNVETKGDGLKRSVLFSLFRAFVQLSQPGTWAGEANVPDIAHRHVILFEEPELYLHPKAQQVLFDSLHEVSKSLQVVVTTHSPLFFSARKTKTFAKLVKNSGGKGVVPFSDLISVDLNREMNLKDEFQILCYENNNVAFFANSVLLVEGDSDVAALKHLAATLNPAWDFDRGKVRMVKVGGKGNFARYRDFFVRFRIDVMVLADLDAIVDGFDKLGLRKDSPFHGARASLLDQVAGLAGPPLVDRDDVKDTWKSRGSRVLQIVAGMKSGEKPSDQDIRFLDAIQEELGQRQAKVAVLKNDPAVQKEKLALLRDLRSEGIMILARGSLEDYYPPTVVGSDKTAKAADFRSKVVIPSAALALAHDVPVSGGRTCNEFEAIFVRVFEGCAVT